MCDINPKKVHSLKSGLLSICEIQAAYGNIWTKGLTMRINVLAKVLVYKKNKKKIIFIT